MFRFELISLFLDALVILVGRILKGRRQYTLSYFLFEYKNFLQEFVII